MEKSLNKYNKEYEEEYDEIIFLEMPFYRIISENAYVLHTVLKIISQNAFKSFVKYLIYYFHSIDLSWNTRKINQKIKNTFEIF